jgi:hypothetical protein
VKHIIFGMVSGLMVVLSIVAVLTVEGRNSRERELRSALRASVKSVVSEAAVSRIDSASDEDDMKERFEDIMNIKLPTFNVTSRSDVTSASASKRSLHFKCACIN